MIMFMEHNILRLYKYHENNKYNKNLIVCYKCYKTKNIRLFVICSTQYNPSNKKKQTTRFIDTEKGIFAV